MQVVSSTEFATHQDKYFDMAVSHDVCIKRGQKTFQLIYRPTVEEQPILQPDDDLRRAITIDEVRDNIVEYIRKKHANKKQ